MALKFMLDTLEGLDEGTAKLYSQGQDKKFYLEVDGAVAKSKLDEFRNTNVNLMKEMEKFKDVDPVKYQELLKKQQEFEGKKMVSMDEVNDMVLERVKTMQNDFNTEKQTMTEANNKLNRQLESLLVDSAVRREASNEKVLASAVDDVLLRAKSVFKVVDGVLTPQDSNGNMVYGKDGTSPLSPGEWVKGLIKTAPHLFEPSVGGGSGGGRNPSGNLDPSKMTSMQKLQAGLDQRKQQ